MTKKKEKKNETACLKTFISNLWIEMPHDELKRFMLERAAYYAKKTALVEEQLVRVRGAVQEAQDVAADDEDDNIAHSGKGSFSNFSNSSNGVDKDWVKTLKQYRDKANAFRFMANHLVPDAIYRLNESDMVKLGLMQSYY